MIELRAFFLKSCNSVADTYFRRDISEMVYHMFKGVSTMLGACLQSPTYIHVHHLVTQDCAVHSFKQDWSILSCLHLLKE